MSSNKRLREEQQLQVSTKMSKTEKGTTEAALVSMDAVFGSSVWLSEHFFCFLDIPTLGKCAQVCKTFQEAVKNDDVWKGHLKLLLEKVFDGAFCIQPRYKGLVEEPVPISQRELRSTNFRAWYKEWSGLAKPHCHIDNKAWWTSAAMVPVKGDHDSYLANRVFNYITGPEGKDIVLDTFFFWFQKDVSLRTYYKEAGNFARLGRQKEVERRQLRRLFHSRRTGYLLFDEDVVDLYSPSGITRGKARHIFRDLPNLRLFYVRYWFTMKELNDWLTMKELNGNDYSWR